MSEREQCLGTTKAGNRCKLTAMEGSAYCHIHQPEEEVPLTASDAPGGDAPAPTDPPAPIPEEAQVAAAEAATEAAAAPAGGVRLSDGDRAEFRRLVAELNAVADELRSVDMSFRPPQLSLSGLVALVEQNLYRFTPQAQREIIQNLRASLQDTKPEDLTNPDTWKGFWYVLNYMAQNQKNELEQKIGARLEKVPGFAILSDLKAGLQQAEPKDFLEPETWKGLAYILRHSTQLQIEQMKERILGKDDE